MDKSGGTKTETTISLKCDLLLFLAVCSISCFVFVFLLCSIRGSSTVQKPLERTIKNSVYN